MKINKTLIFALLTISLTAFVYFYEYKGEKVKEAAESSEILKFSADQITYFQIIKPDVKMAFQRDEKGWGLLEPIFEPADTDKINELLTVFESEAPVTVVKATDSSFADAILSEYGLDKPAVVYVFKNNAGQSRRIAVGSVKNFEGQSYLHIDSGNKIILGSPTWAASAQDELIYFRDKRIFREPIASVNRMLIHSLNERIEIRRTDGKWVSSATAFELDQPQIRDILKKISDTQIENYVFEGEPSRSVLKEKGLEAAPVSVELFTDSTSWTAKIHLDKESQKLYLLSDRPTYLAQVSLPVWEAVAGLTLDGLRDRVTAFAFSADEVKKIYYKNNDKETNLIFNSGTWLMGSNNSPYLEVDKSEISKTIKKIHTLKISEFIDTNVKDKFSGNNMLILKSDSEKLVLQLNWGPGFTLKKDGKDVEYYYARTHLAENIFALEKQVIEDLNLAAEKIKRKNSDETNDTGELKAPEPEKESK